MRILSCDKGRMKPHSTTTSQLPLCNLNELGIDNIWAEPALLPTTTNQGCLLRIAALERGAAWKVQHLPGSARLWVLFV